MRGSARPRASTQDFSADRARRNANLARDPQTNARVAFRGHALDKLRCCQTQSVRVAAPPRAERRCEPDLPFELRDGIASRRPNRVRIENGSRSSARMNVASETCSILLRFGAQCSADRDSQAVPACSLFPKSFSPGSGQPVKLGATIVLGSAPFGFEQPLMFKPIERG